MKVRLYIDSDLAQIEALHKKADMDYSLPPMSSFFSKRVIDGPAGVGMAVFQRLNSEVFLVCDPEWRTPAWRLEAIRQLHIDCNADAREAGAQEAISFLPPAVEEKFGKRLLKMGWAQCRSDWKCYYKGIR